MARSHKTGKGRTHGTGAVTIRRGKATMKLVGFGTIYKRLQELSDNAAAAGAEVLTRAVNRVYRKSQTLVPVDPEDGGQLRASGKMSKARHLKRSGKVSASVTYGGARLQRLAPGDNPLYAIVQHEDLSARHTTGQAKFLEQPATEEKPRIMGDLKREIMKAVTR